jgi:hypothetical protein
VYRFGRERNNRKEGGGGISGYDLKWRLLGCSVRYKTKANVRYRHSTPAPTKCLIGTTESGSAAAAQRGPTQSRVQKRMPIVSGIMRVGMLPVAAYS